MYCGAMVTREQQCLQMRVATWGVGPDILALISALVMIDEQLGHLSGSKEVASGFQKYDSS